MKNRGFDFGDFEITKREILASISIIAMMLLIGFVISGRISNYILDRNEKYNKAIKIESSDLFEYGMRTNVGYAFVYGDLKAVDTVSYPEINGEYMYIEKIEEHYNMHTRTVTTTDSKGKTHTRNLLVLGLCRKRRTKMFRNYIFRTHLPIEQGRVSKY